MALEIVIGPAKESNLPTAEGGDKEIVVGPGEVGEDFIPGAETAPTEQLPGIDTEDTVSELVPLPEGAETEPGFFGSVAEGFGIREGQTVKNWWDEYVDESITIGAGGVLAEQQIKFQDPELFKANQGAAVYERWQPQIWDAQLELAGIKKSSPRYQELTSKISELRENMRDDLEGKYLPDPTDPISITKMLEAAADNPGFMMGALAKGLAQDPGLMMTPAGWVKAGHAAVKAAKVLGAGKKTQAVAKVAGQVLGGGSITGGFGAVENVVQQLENNPNAPINKESILKAAAAMSLLGAAPPPLLAAGKGAGAAVSSAVGKFYTDAKLEQIQETAIELFNKGEGTLTKQQAIEQAVAKHHPFDSEKVLTRLDDPDVVIDDTSARIAYGENRIPETFTQKTKRMSLETADEVIRGLNAFFQPVITGIRRLGFMTVAANLLRHDMNEMKKLSDRLILKDAYSKARKKLTKDQRRRLKFHVLNGTLDEVAGEFTPEVIKAYKDVRKMLEEMRAEMIENGMLKRGPDMEEDHLPGIEDFWPRDIDFKAYAKSKGVDVRNFDLYAKAINRKYALKAGDQFQSKDLTTELINEYLSPEEIALAIADEVAGKITPKTTIATDSLQRRTVDVIAPEDLQHYSDDVVSLTNYILKFTPKIEARNFFGGVLLKAGPKQREKLLASEDIPSANPLRKDSMVKGFVDDYVDELVDQGVVLEQKAPELAGLLEARFAGGFKRPAKFVAGLKNVIYGMLLGNQWSAAVQLGDLGSSAYINGVNRTLNAVNKKAMKKVGVDVEDFLTMDDYGLSAMAHELEHLGPTAAFNDWALKLGMFKMADRLGKEAIMNASVAKNKAAVKNLQKLRAAGADTTAAEAKAKAHFRKQYGDKVDDATIEGMMEAFAKGDIRDPDAMLATFADITKVQPISLSEMPKLYLNHPNGRIVYMLKTFTLKQIDLLRTSILQQTAKDVKEAKTKNGKIFAVARGHGRMLHLLGTIGIANAGVEATRQFLLGDPDFDFTEAMFSTALIKFLGYQPYLADKIANGQIPEAAGSLFTPAVGVIAEPIEELVEGDPVGFLLTLPVLRAGKQFYEQSEDTPIEGWGSSFDNSDFSSTFDED